jgi:hypothetical protein
MWYSKERAKISKEEKRDKRYSSDDTVGEIIFAAFPEQACPECILSLSNRSKDPLTAPVR